MPGPIAFRPSSPSPEMASARLRCFLPVRYLRAAGWECEVFEPSAWQRYRAVVLQKAYAEEDLTLADCLRAHGIRVIFDLCDNHFYVPTDRPDLRERANRLRRMIDRADAVSVCTNELARHVGRPSTVIDDALDEIAPGWLAPWQRTCRTILARCWRKRFQLVWFGNAGLDSPPFGLIDLARLVPVLNELDRHVPLSLTVISNSRDAFVRHLAGARFPTRYREYHTHSVQGLLQAHDVCVIPVSPNPFTLSKTINRPALALLLGVPVVADAIPSYEDLRPFILMGSWRNHLSRYAQDHDLRQHHVEAGRHYLRQRYTPQNVVEQWSKFLTPLLA